MVETSGPYTIINNNKNGIPPLLFVHLLLSCLKVRLKHVTVIYASFIPLVAVTLCFIFSTLCISRAEDPNTAVSSEVADATDSFSVELLKVTKV